jgi:hypothetical protein
MTAPVVFFELLRAQRLGAHACERRNSALAGGTGCRRELDSLPQAATLPTSGSTLGGCDSGCAETMPKWVIFGIVLPALNGIARG